MGTDRHEAWSSRQLITVAAAGLLLAMSSPCPGAAAPLPLRPTAIDPSPNSLRVTLVNDGALAVIGFCMTSRNGPVETTEDMPPRPPLVAVGGSRTETMPIKLVSPDDLDAEVRSFSVTCVQWEDGSVEGRPEHVALLLKIEAGRAFEWTRLLPMSERIQQSTDAEWSAALANAGQWIATNGATLDDGTRAEGSFASGMGGANLAFKMTLDSLQRLSVDAAGMASAREHLADMVSQWRITRDFVARVKGLSAYRPM